MGIINSWCSFLSLLLKQILTQEDWNKVLYNGMASTSPLAALYFIALMTFGNYVLFNLLVAILVEGFQTEVFASSKTPFWMTNFDFSQRYFWFSLPHSSFYVFFLKFVWKTLFFSDEIDEFIYSLILKLMLVTGHDMLFEGL